MKKYSLWILIFIAVIEFVVICDFAYRWIKNKTETKIIFINPSHLEIRKVSIGYCQESVTFENVKYRTEKTISVKGDCSFSIRILFADGDEINQHLDSYITSNDGTKNYFLVASEEDIILPEGGTLIGNKKIIYFQE